MEPRPWRRKGNGAADAPSSKADLIKTVAGKIGKALRFMRRDMERLRLDEDGLLIEVAASLVDVLRRAGHALAPAAPLDMARATDDVRSLIGLLGGVATPLPQVPQVAAGGAHVPGKGKGKGKEAKLKQFKAWRERQAAAEQVREGDGLCDDFHDEGFW